MKLDVGGSFDDRRQCADKDLNYLTLNFYYETES